MAYVAWNRGFKSGLFNTIIPPDFGPNILAPGVPTIDPPVEPEDIDAYTLGFKSELVDNTLRLNAEAFYYKYENLQLQQVLIIPGGGTATRLTNAAKATIQGIDIDLLWQPTDQLSITAAVEFLDGEYDDFPDGQYFIHGVSAGGPPPIPRRARPWREATADSRSLLHPPLHPAAQQRSEPSRRTTTRLPDTGTSRATRPFRHRRSRRP